MFAIRFMKSAPTSYVLHFQNGRLHREGPGLSFFYYGPTSTIVSVPLASADIPFAFQENTADFQSVTIQGQLTYRVADPKRLAGLLDFSINPQGAYRSEDFRKLPERLVHSLQTLMQAETQRFVLRDVLTSSGPLGKSVFAALQSSELVTQLGVEVLNLRCFPYALGRRWQRLWKRRLVKLCSGVPMRLFMRGATTLWSRNAALERAN
jgi:regulator of protease activity HflC (stomatin/prohibitin superfamily)